LSGRDAAVNSKRNMSLCKQKLTNICNEVMQILDTGCFTTLRPNCRRWFPRSLWSKTSYKHVSDFGRLRSYDRFKLRMEGNDYWRVRFSDRCKGKLRVTFGHVSTQLVRCSDFPKSKASL
jgi:hypothetical protein